MAAADTLIVRDGPVTAPLDYQQPAGSEIIPVCATASFDGSGAGSAFLPTLEVIAPDGHVVARCPVNASVAAGASADVTWFPGVAEAAAASSGGSGPAVLFETTLGAITNIIDTGADGIAVTHKDLLIVTWLRTDEAIGAAEDCALQINGDQNGNHYKDLRVAAHNTSISAFTGGATSGWNCFSAAGGSADAGLFAPGVLFIPNYAAATTKAALGLQGNNAQFASSANWQIEMGAHTYNQSGAITRLAWLVNAGGGARFVAGCRVIVYGLG